MRFSVNKTAVLGVLFFLCFLAGWADSSQLRGGEQEAMLLSIHAFLSAILIFLWVRQDAWEASYRLSWSLRIGVLLLSVLALPWYFFRSRGAKRGAWALAWLVLGFVVAMLFYRVGTRFGGGA